MIDVITFWVRRALLAADSLREARRRIADYHNLHLEADMERMDAQIRRWQLGR